ncbi:carbohydrate kinase family protein [Paeniglutamicibacter psychrophenolicus]|uniref:carbohydrate kinase family protein n=1 Tax=Paeniglutamicibacter psychrophenolicus TaxID=257454 RepID=UPI0027858E7D|nr:carbohydrate kinase [Paeniglutamicibacter psychrophenolicus]MDQ0095062.1 fructokinase [Paeniglutamicibacter psychrophenolicus]
MLTVIGEALVDVLSGGISAPRSFVGGSPLNVAVGLAKLGHPTTFIGRWGKDEYGVMIQQALAANDVRYICGPDDAPTSTARGILDPVGAASYTFDMHWDLPELPADTPALAEARAVHTGSLATLVEPGASKVRKLIEAARPHATISYDPNIRPSLVTDHAKAVADVERFVALADVVRASDSDLEWLYPHRSVQDTAAAWLALGPAMVIATYGSGGPWGLVKAGTARTAAPVVDVADTVGAGDSFISAMISALESRGLLGSERRGQLHALDTGTLTEILDYAARAAAITVSRPGANPPTRQEIS